MGALDGQVAIVTGGGSGIGSATALLLAREGAHAFVVGRRQEPLDDVVEAIRRDGGSATALQADVGDCAQSVDVAKRTLDAAGRIDILVNNAGHGSKARSILYLTQAEWDSVLDVNLNGLYALTRAALPNMVDRGSGTIVTVASIAAIKPSLLGGAAYGAAKAAARNLMDHVRVALRNKGIRATTIMPGEVDTPLLDNRPKPPDARARATMMGAEDVARTILLCVTLPQRTLIEEIVMNPTVLRDLSPDIAAAARAGAPKG